MFVKLTGLFYILNGVSMLIVWTLLIATNSVPELHTQFVYMIFHLISEFATAVLCIIVGVGLLLKSNLWTRIYFLSTGLSLVAGYLACAYYLFTPETRNIVMAFMLFGINLVIILLLVSNSKVFYPSRKTIANKTILLFDGAFIYVLLNVTGMLIDKGTGYAIGYAGAVLILFVYVVWNSIYVIKHNLTEDKNILV